MVQKILKAYTYFTDAGIHKNEVMNLRIYLISKMYKQMRGDLNKVKWWRLAWSNYGVSKWKFILLLACMEDYLLRQGSQSGDESTTYSLCDQGDERTDHVFFIFLYCLCYLDETFGLARHSSKKFEIDKLKLTRH